MPLTNPQRHRNRVATLARYHRGSPEHAAAVRDLAAAKLEDYIEQVVASAPPLTPEQRDKLALLLRSGGGGAA